MSTVFCQPSVHTEYIFYIKKYAPVDFEGIIKVHGDQDWFWTSENVGNDNNFDWSFKNNLVQKKTKNTTDCYNFSILVSKLLLWRTGVWLKMFILLKEITEKLNTLPF